MKKPQDKISNFFSRYPLIKITKNTEIFRANEDPDGTYYIKRGFVKMVSIFKDGSELTLNIFKPGSFIPMFWAFSDKRNDYFYYAMTDLKVYKAPTAEVMRYLSENPEELFDLTERIISGVKGFLSNLQTLLYGTAYTRVASALVISAKRFGQEEDGGKIAIKLRLTHQDIASLSGITRETASIALKKLDIDGFISYKGRYIYVNNLEKLIEESSKTE